jgi:CheY-like chemotaxis protein
LTFAKGGEPVKEISSLADVVKDSADFVLHGSNVACNFNLPDDLWLVDIDKGQISQVVQNIILNGIHAMPKGGVIRISCKNVTLTKKDKVLALPAGDFVKISIRDTGIGIAEKHLEKIFDPYFSTKQKGSGLGLAICQSIIDKHGGYIAVDSTPGSGTVFSIYLPVSESGKKLTSQKQEDAPETLSAAKVLVMDDEPMVRDVAEAMLTTLGNEVVLAVDGEEAIKLYREAMESPKPVRLVIMDLTIPGGMGGKDAVREIHKLDPDARVVVTSGYSNDPILANFKDYGFWAAIVKPFQIKDLKKVLSILQTEDLI